MPEKPTGKSPSKAPPKSPPKPLTSITRPSTSSGTPNPRGTKPAGPGATRPPLANQHDRIWKIMKM